MYIFLLFLQNLQNMLPTLAWHLLTQQKKLEGQANWGERRRKKTGIRNADVGEESHEMWRNQLHC